MILANLIFFPLILRMSNNSKKIKSLLNSWLTKSRETKKTQKVLAAKLKAIIAHVEWRAEVDELNEIQSLAGMISKP